MQKTVVLALLTMASTQATSSNLRRDLYGKNTSSSSSSSSSGWSFWGSLFQLLDQMHTPCPPGKMHHKDSNGEPLHRGECWQDLKPHKKHHHHSGGSHGGSGGSGSSGGGGGGGGSSSAYLNYTFVECNQGDENCYQNLLCEDICTDDDATCECMEYISCPDDDADCMEWITCDDDGADCMVNVHGNGWGGDGNDDALDDAMISALEYADDDWYNDGWTQSNLDQGSAYSSQGVTSGKRTPLWPFLLAALVAGLLVAFMVVGRRRRREERSEHPLDGAVRKRQRLFAGMTGKKAGALNEDFDNEDERPNFVDISSSGKSSYENPTCD